MKVGKLPENVWKRSVRKMIPLHTFDSDGAGISFKINGYDLIGKTGTAQIADGKGGYLKGDVNRSIALMFPKDDPQIIIYGAAKYAKSINPLSNSVKDIVINLSKYYNLYDNNDTNEHIEISLDNYVNRNIKTVSSNLKEEGLDVIVIGDGDTIINQYPNSGNKLIKNDKGEYHLNLPQETIPEPSLILTGKESFSRQSGEMINAVFTNNNMADIDIQSNSIATNHPQAFLAQNNQLQHLIIVGSETCLNKWSHFACKDSDKRAKNSALCVIKDGHIIYDSETSSKRYMIEGVMDDMLIEGLNSEDPNRVSRIVEIFPEVEAEKLKPFAKKIGQAPTTASLLEQINRKQMGR